MYNLPLRLILDKLVDIDNKLSLLVENQSIDIEKEMEKEMEIEKEEHDEKEKNGRKSKRGANKCM